MTLIEQFTDTLPKTRGQTYKSNIKSYFRYLAPDPEHEKQYDRYIGIPLSKKQKDYVNTYFNNNRDYKKDLKNFVLSLNGAPPKTIKSKVAAIKSFFEHYDIELKNKDWKDIKKEIKGSRAVTLDKVPSKEELKQILAHATVKDRALFLTLVSSGMRIGEACQITLDDIKDLPMIKIRAKYAKSDNARVTFVSPEAQEAIEAWLPLRDDYLRVAVKRLNCQKPSIEGKRPERIVKDRHDNRVFPIATSTARTMWNRLLTKSGYDDIDPSSGIHSIHIHCLRKYFSSHLNINGCPHDIVEALLGHEEKLSRVYNIYTHAQLKDIYDQYVSGVCVFQDHNTDDRINSMETQVNTLKSENEKLEHRLNEFTELMREMLQKNDTKDK